MNGVKPLKRPLLHSESANTWVFKQHLRTFNHYVLGKVLQIAMYYMKCVQKINN